MVWCYFVDSVVSSFTVHRDEVSQRKVHYRLADGSGLVGALRGAGRGYLVGLVTSVITYTARCRFQVGALLLPLDESGDGVLYCTRVCMISGVYTDMQWEFFS